MTATTPAERAALKRSLAALCAERGYPQVTLAALCERAGVGEGEFRRHFADLDACFTATVAEGVETMLAAVAAAFQADADWRDQLRACAYALADYLRADPDWARLMVVEAAVAPEPAREARDRGMQALAALLDLGREGAADPDSIPPHTAEVTAGAIYNRIHTVIAAGEIADLDRLVPETMHAAVLPYRGTEAALAEIDLPRP